MPRALTSSVSENGSLDLAKTTSLANAIANAAASIGTAQNVKLDSAAGQQLGSLIRDASTITDTWFSYDVTNRLYKFYTRIHLSSAARDLASRLPPDARAFTAPGQTPSQTTLQIKGWSPVDLTSDPQAGMFVLDKTGAISKVVSTPQGPHLEPVVTAQLSGQNGYIAANYNSLFVATDFPAGCIVHRYSLTGATLKTRPVMTTGAPNPSRCGGIATNGDEVFVALPTVHRIDYWSNWDDKQAGSIDINQVKSGVYTSMVFDRTGHQIIVVDGYGSVFTAAWAPGESKFKVKLLTNAPNSTGNAVSVSSSHIFLAANNKVQSLSRPGGKKETFISNPKLSPHLMLASPSTKTTTYGLRTRQES